MDSWKHGMYGRYTLWTLGSMDIYYGLKETWSVGSTFIQVIGHEVAHC